MPQQRRFEGLSETQINASRIKHGSNILTPPVKESLFSRFISKFEDPLITILLVAGVLSVIISCYEYWGLDQGPTVFFEPVGIFMAIILATGLAFVFELKADKEFDILNKVNDDTPVQVIRNGNTIAIPKKDVVVGDIVLLNTGDEVPADGKLLEAVTLSIDESTLTGEPSCTKTTDPTHFDPDATFPSDNAMRGTKIMEGHGIMDVFAVGDMTENGKVYKAAQIDNSVKTPLDEQFDRLGRMISIFSYIIAVAVIIGRLTMYFIHQDFDWISFII